MTTADLSEAGWERSDARAIARRLSTWQRLDLALVDKTGEMRYCAETPVGPTGALIRSQVLQFAGKDPEGGRRLIPGPRFFAVKQAVAETRGAANG